MLCDKCKSRDAKIYYTEVVNGEIKEQHLCEECAAECTHFHLNSKMFNNKDVTVGDILASILGNYRNATNSREESRTDSNNESTSKEKSKEPVLRCESCGMTYDEFLQEGKFGCVDCYHYFQRILARSLKNLHGADTHTGKQPKGYVSTTHKIINDLTEIDKKNILLQEAIEKEEFEEAARIRDEIRALRAQEQESKELQETNKEEINNA